MVGMAKLSRTIVTILLAGRHAVLGGRTTRERAAHLARIASAYSRAELEAEKGIGPARAAELERWLAGQGFSLRIDRECPIASIEGAELVTSSQVEQLSGLVSR